MTKKEKEILKIQLETCEAICDIWDLPKEDLKYLKKYFRGILGIWQDN